MKALVITTPLKSILKTTRLPDVPASKNNNNKDMVVRFSGNNKKLVRKLGKFKAKNCLSFENQLSQQKNCQNVAIYLNLMLIKLD